MADTVKSRGTDSLGRAILATDRMWDWWQAVVAELGFTPTIVQGAFMSRVPGGGASDSAGYHDLGACFDLRTWDLTAQQQERLVRTLRLWGAAAWRRDQRHGMDPHVHFVFGADRPWTQGAAAQWNAYLSGRDGLASNGPDYEWRPEPLVLRPPEVDMPLTEDDANKVVEALMRYKPKGSDLALEQLIKQAANSPGMLRKIAAKLGVKL